MLNWKLVVTAIIVIVLALAVVGSHPSLRGIVASLTERLPSAERMPIETERPVGFSLSLDSYPLLRFSATNATVVIEPVLMAGTVKGVDVNTAQRVEMHSFYGDITLADREVALNGAFERFELPDVIVVLGRVDISGMVETLRIDNLALRNVTIPAAYGRLHVDDTTLVLDASELRLDHVLARVELASSLSMIGNASRITLGQQVVIA